MKGNLPKFRAFLLPTTYILIIAISFFVLKKFRPTSAADSPSVIYSDYLSSTWTNWSWGASINFSNPAPNNSGSKSIWVQLSPWGALYAHSNSEIDLSAYSHLSFAIQSQGDNEKFQLLIYNTSLQPQKTLPLSNYGPQPNKESYTVYKIPVADFGTGKISGIALQDATGTQQAPIFIDTIQFIPKTQTTNTTNLTNTQIKEAVVYGNWLSEGWKNWSWSGNVDFNNSFDFFSAGKSLSFTPNNPWAGLYLHNDKSVDISPYKTLHFAIKSQSANPKFQIALYGDDDQPLSGFKSLDSWGTKMQFNRWLVYDIPLSDISPGTNLIKGIAIQQSGNVEWNKFTVDDLKLTSVLKSQPVVNTITPTQTPAPAPQPTAAPQIVVTGSGFTSANGKVYKDGKAITLRGINWFGAETETHVFHGLWQRGYQEMIAQIKTLGFNSVRVPVCPDTIEGVAVTSVDYSKNSDLKGLNSIQVLDKVLGEMDKAGIYTLLDHHRPDCQSISELWYKDGYTEDAWINDLKTLAVRYKNLSNFIGIDLKNEPHGSATWGTGNARTDWNTAAERAGSKVLSVNPNILIFVEGIGDNPVCSSNIQHNWGGNLEMQKCNPISAASIPADRLVLSPHVYGPDVFYSPYFYESNFPNNMPQIWETHFGFLKNQGYTIVPGEWGGKYGTNGGNIKDVSWHDKVVSYFIDKGICNSYYWSLNPNSGDTGGILQDDWESVQTTKLNLLTRYYQNCR